MKLTFTAIIFGAAAVAAASVMGGKAGTTLVRRQQEKPDNFEDALEYLAEQCEKDIKDKIGLNLLIKGILKTSCSGPHLLMSI